MLINKYVTEYYLIILKEMNAEVSYQWKHVKVGNQVKNTWS